MISQKKRPIKRFPPPRTALSNTARCKKLTACTEKNRSPLETAKQHPEYTQIHNTTSCAANNRLHARLTRMTWRTTVITSKNGPTRRDFRLAACHHRVTNTAGKLATFAHDKEFKFPVKPLTLHTIAPPLHTSNTHHTSLLTPHIPERARKGKHHPPKTDRNKHVRVIICSSC